MGRRWKNVNMNDRRRLEAGSGKKDHKERVDAPEWDHQARRPPGQERGEGSRPSEGKRAQMQEETTAATERHWTGAHVRWRDGERD